MAQPRSARRYTRDSFVFSEIFFLLTTWTLTKLCPRTRPNFRLAERRMIPISSPFHQHFHPALRLPPFCFFTLTRLTQPTLSSSPSLSLSFSLSPPNFPSLFRADPTDVAELTYKLCFQVNFPGNAEFSKLWYSITLPSARAILTSRSFNDQGEKRLAILPLGSAILTTPGVTPRASDSRILTRELAYLEKECEASLLI